MAIIINSKQEFTYTPYSERGTEKPFSVTFKLLGAQQLAKLDDNLIMVVQDEGMSVKRGTYSYKAVKASLVSWSNVEDEKGKVELVKNSKGEAVDLKELVEIKRKLKEGISFETVQDFILPIQDKGDFVYSILFKDVEYTAEISSQGVIDVSINKTGNAKEIDGNIYYEYIVPGIDFTDITLYQFGEENEEILINDLNLYFNQEKEGFFIYYFKKQSRLYTTFSS